MGTTNKLIGLLLLIISVSGCNAPIQIQDTASEMKPVFYNAKDIVTLDVSNAPDWAKVATEQAIIFWSNHGISFEAQDNGIPVSGGLVPEEALGIYTLQGTIVLSPELSGDTTVASCTMAHELGHSIQMQHVSNAGGMMSVHESVNSDGTCMWNDADQNELVRVLSLY